MFLICVLVGVNIIVKFSQPSIDKGMASEIRAMASRLNSLEDKMNKLSCGASGNEPRPDTECVKCRCAEHEVLLADLQQKVGRMNIQELQSAISSSHSELDIKISALAELEDKMQALIDARVTMLQSQIESLKNTVSAVSATTAEAAALAQSAMNVANEASATAAAASAAMASAAAASAAAASASAAVAPEAADVAEPNTA